MIASCLLDSNVLVYAHDAGEPRKQVIAREVVRSAIEGDSAVTPQVLGEFFVVTTRSFRTLLAPEEAALQVEVLAQVFRVCPIDAATSLEALSGALRHGMHYWDAQIWAVARLNHIPVVLSEDFSAGTEIEGVRFVDPFADGFDPASVWGD
jgi:predicted nucleic acid-binding protein